MTSLEWKTALLKHIKKKGIWLLDASVHACAIGKRERLPHKVVKQIIPVSWNKYVKPIIEDASIDEEFVWIIGKQVHDILTGKYIQGSNWIYQPNAIFSKDSKWFKVKKMKESELIEAINRRCEN